MLEIHIAVYVSENSDAGHMVHVDHTETVPSDHMVMSAALEQAGHVLDRIGFSVLNEAKDQTAQWQRSYRHHEEQGSG